MSDGVQELETTKGNVFLWPGMKNKESDFVPPANWRLFDRVEKIARMPDGTEASLFFERWVHQKSQSGVVAYSTFETQDGTCQYGYAHRAAEPYFVVEGYGIGTIRTGNFTEMGGAAPIQRSEHESLDDARQALRSLMEDNEELFVGGDFRNRQATTQQLPKGESQQ